MSEYVLELRGITKIFPGVKALDKVHFQLKPGEIVITSYSIHYTKLYESHTQATHQEYQLENEFYYYSAYSAV